MKAGQAVWKLYTGTFKQINHGSVEVVNENTVQVRTTNGMTEQWDRSETHKVRDPKLAAAISGITGLSKQAPEPEPEHDGQPTELQENEDFAHDGDFDNQEPTGDGMWS